MSGYRRLLRVISGAERARDREIDDEIEAHLDMRAADLMAAGMPEPEARRLARERFGDLDRARRELRAAAGRRDARLGLIEQVARVRRDLVVALRRARSAPGLTALTVGIFALGLGLTTVMFSVVDDVLLRPLPFPEADRLVALWSVEETGGAFAQVSMGNWYDWRERNQTLESTGLHSYPRDVTVSTDSDVFTVPGVLVGGAFFETLRPAMTLGGAPDQAEMAEQGDGVVVSEAFWRRVLGSDPALNRRSLILDGRDRRVLGVIRQGLEYPAGVDVWLPDEVRPFVGGARNNINYLAVGRLAQTATIEQAEADLSAIADGIRASDPEGIYSFGVRVRPLQDVVVGDAGGYLGILMAAVGFVLLIACANLAALGFARGSERTSEVALRLSLGAGRGTLVQQLMTEQILLALMGGAIGVTLAWWGVGALTDWVASVVPRAHEIHFDARVALFGVVISSLAGAIAGLAPALRIAEGSPVSAMSGTRTVRGGGGLTGSILVGAEVALTVLLLTGGGLLVMSLGAVSSRDLGFRAEGVVTAEIALTSSEYRNSAEAVTNYWTRMVGELSSLPAVEAVGLGNWIPTGGGGSTFIELPAEPEPGAGAGYRVVSDAYFAVLGVPLVDGRAFDASDQAGTQRVVIVNRSMAERFWPGIDALGQLVKAPSMEGYFYGGSAPWLTVIGVVDDVRHGGFESEPRPEMFTLYRQVPGMSTAMTAVVRVRDGQSQSVLASIRERGRSVDPALAVSVSTLDARVHRLLGERRLITTILAAFAAVALALAALGIYGVISFAVAARTQEMAVRAALGARRTGLVRLMMVGALRVVLVGALVGVGLAIGLRGVLDSLLLDVGSADPVAYVGAGSVLIAVAIVAAFLPAWRAARMNPLEALRSS